MQVPDGDANGARKRAGDWGKNAARSLTVGAATSWSGFGLSSRIGWRVRPFKEEGFNIFPKRISKQRKCC
jgi:hypothetical protein